MVLSRGTGFAGPTTGVVKKVYRTKEKRRIFIPAPLGSNHITPYPIVPGTTGTLVSASEVESKVYTSAVKDKETLDGSLPTINGAYWRNDFNGTGVSGWEYEVVVIITYKNIVP